MDTEDVALRPWIERIQDVSGPKKMNMYDYDSDIPLNNSKTPSVVQAKIYNTPGNTPLNEAKGPLVEFQGKYTNNWRDIYLGQNFRTEEPPFGVYGGP